MELDRSEDTLQAFYNGHFVYFLGFCFDLFCLCLFVFKIGILL